MSSTKHARIKHGGKFFAHRAVKAYRGSRGIAPLIFNLGTSCWWVAANFTPWSLCPRERTAIYFEEEAGWTPGPVWRFGERKMFLPMPGLEPPIVQPRSRVTIPTTGVRIRSGLGCPKYPYSDLILGVLTFRHRASCILGQAFRYSPENAFYIFNQQIYFII